MSHDIVPTLLFFCSSDLELLYVEMLQTVVSILLGVEQHAKTYKVIPHLLYSLFRDGQAELLLSNGEVKPQLAPCMKPVLGMQELAQVYETSAGHWGAPLQRINVPSLCLHIDYWRGPDIRQSVSTPDQISHTSKVAFDRCCRPPCFCCAIRGLLCLWKESLCVRLDMVAKLDRVGARR